jgi:hypothetical protein
MLTKTRKHIRRLSAGSVAALIYSGTIFALLVSLHVYVWNLPTDGWSIRRGGDDQTLMYAKLEANVVGLPSDLQPGDNVIAVEGTPLVQMVIRAYKFWQYPPPIGQDGEMLRYTVLRGERQLDIDVPTQRIGAIAHIRNSLTLAVGVTNPTAALLEVIASLAFSLVSLFVFALRPNEPASRALLIIGAAFFFQHYYMVDSIPLLGYTAVAYWFLFMSTWILAILPALLYLSLALPRP